MADQIAGHGRGRGLAVGVMLFAAGPVSAFVDRHPTVKMLALSFLLLIGFVAGRRGPRAAHPKGYIYFAMAFSVFVEMLNLRAAAGRGGAPPGAPAPGRMRRRRPPGRSPSPPTSLDGRGSVVAPPAAHAPRG